MKLLKRELTEKIQQSLQKYPVTAIIGSRQVGKSTLAKSLLQAHPNSLYLDLERPKDRQLLDNAEDFFSIHKEKLICLDEIQLVPGVFSVMRSIVDDETYHNKFLVLGSATPELLRQTSQTLAGRIAYHELTPFLWEEVGHHTNLNTYRLRGGFPKSLLAESDEDAMEWIAFFIRTFLEKDLQQFGLNLTVPLLQRLWMMLAHSNGQVINFSKLGSALGVSHHTIRRYIDILEHTFQLRVIYPYFANTKKRLIKSPKVFIRDTGILHALLGIASFDELFRHPVYGSSWESTVIENVIHKYQRWNHYFFRTVAGAEIDLLLEKANKKIAIEIKASSTPTVTKGFWSALDTVQPDETYIIAPVPQPFPFKNGVWVYPLEAFLKKDV